jgi:predicted outer membrane repeat protein
MRNDMGMFGGPCNLSGHPVSNDEGAIGIFDSTISENISYGDGGGIYVSTTELSAGSGLWSLYE